MRKEHLRRIVTAVFFAVPISLAGQTPQTRGPANNPVVRPDVRELPADQQIVHALSRLTFGPKSGDVARVRAIGLDRWIDQQLHPERIDDSAMEAFVAKYPTINQLHALSRASGSSRK